MSDAAEKIQRMTCWRSQFNNFIFNKSADRKKLITLLVPRGNIIVSMQVAAGQNQARVNSLGPTRVILQQKTPRGDP